jgi:hypothetical protein
VFKNSLQNGNEIVLIGGRAVILIATFPDLEDSQKRFLGDIDPADPLHPALAFLLFF